MREDWEAWESNYLVPLAAKSKDSKGRVRPEEECPLRTAYQRDRDRIIHSKAFRRLKHKTQVFIAPRGDHYRTRLTHTLEVSQISRTIARALKLNEDLAEAIAMGHDLGHTPFGHAGERTLAELFPGFSHNKQSLRVVDVLERGGQGLNLTYEVRDGILNHSGEGFPSTLEGEIVRICDRIAYVNHDIDDALRAEIFSYSDLPLAAREVLGDSHSNRIDTMVTDVVRESEGQARIRMSAKVAQAMDELRNYLFTHVYFRREAREEEERIKTVIKNLFAYYMEHPVEMATEYVVDPGTEIMVCDYIAGMTDHFALQKYQELCQ